MDFLEQVVLGEIRRLTKYAGLYEDDFLKEVIGHSRQAEEPERKLKEKELKTLLARDEELTASLNVSMRTMFPASSRMTALPKCPADTKMNRRRYPRRSRPSVLKWTSSAESL